MFWTTQLLRERPMVDRAQITVESSGTLRIECLVGECRVSGVEAHDEPESADLLPLCSRFRKAPLQRIESLSRGSEFVGIAAIDKEHLGSVYALFLAVSDWSIAYE